MPELSPETAALRAALDAANSQIASERQQRVQIEGRLRTETGNRFAAQEVAVDTALTQAEQKASTLQERWVALQEEGKFSEAAAVMREVSQNEATIAQLRGQKEWVAGQRQAATAAPADPLERFNEAERAWIARNPRYTEDPAFARKVNAAATHATEFDGLVKDSPEYWSAIERKVYPERQQQLSQTDDGGAPAGDTGGMPAAGDTGVQFEQQHTMSAPVTPPTVDAPVMDIPIIPAERPEAPQQRAVGRGSDGMRGVAAPPSRRIVDASNRAARGNRIEPTQQEWETAQALYDTIEPNATDRRPETIIRWYYALAHDPSHQRTRRRSWAADAVL